MVEQSQYCKGMKITNIHMKVKSQHVRDTIGFDQCEIVCARGKELLLLSVISVCICASLKLLA